MDGLCDVLEVWCVRMPVPEGEASMIATEWDEQELQQ